MMKADWGVYANPRSLRRERLTFEHQGCREFEHDERIEGGIERPVRGHPEVYRPFNHDEALSRCARREGLDWSWMSDEERKSFAENLLSRRARE